MINSLKELVEAYMTDSQWQGSTWRRTKARNQAFPQIQALAHNFVSGQINLRTLFQQLNEAFRTTGERWGAQGNSFTLPLDRLARTHDDPTPIAEPKLRQLLADLGGSNMGEKIELFHSFLLDERARLRQENKRAVGAGTSAMIISLFNFWLHPDGGSIIYHEGVRHGLGLLVKQQLLRPAPELNRERDTVKILTNRDHQAYMATVQILLDQYPQLRTGPYWSEYFFYWVVEYFQKHTQTALSQPTLIKEQDEAGILTSEPMDGSAFHETTTGYENEEIDGPQLASIVYENDPLVPTPEPTLTRLIHEVQRHVLIEESVVRRIYHALLAGHVVLSGPPGTGKTELARLIPEILWRSAEDGAEANGDEEVTLTSTTAYTTRLVTATDEWSVRTLISGITPVSKNGVVTYKVQDGHLTATIKKNWSIQGNVPEEWSTLPLRRTPVTSHSGVERGMQQTFRGQWLVIDEFNRAPIDLALGEALTALGGNDVLRVMTEDGSMELPIPKDFRVIGTLNSFDRNYLNQISEALKRRFSFVEILPPGRHLREAEQAIVLYKALERVSHLSKEIITENGVFTWETITVEAESEGGYIITWPDDNDGFYKTFESAWCLLDIIRIYRQLGTAQAISLVCHMLIAGILQGYATRDEWMIVLDAALCDTIADQLQVLLPDEIEALLLALTCERPAFGAAYNHLLSGLVDRQQRLYGQLLSLGNISDEHGVPYLSDEEIEACAHSNPPVVAEQKLSAIFHLDAPLYRLPQFTRRLRAFKAERGL